MLSIPHMLTGAFTASKIPNPAAYVPITLGFHYLQDWIPHWDVGTGLSNGKRSRKSAIIMELIELGIAITVIWFFFQRGNAEIQYHIWLGALVGIVPDLLEAPRNFLKWEPSFLKPINEFHSFFHHSTPNIPLGLIPQAVLVVVILLLN